MHHEQCCYAYWYARQLLKAVSLAAERDGQELNDGLAELQTSLLLEPPHVRSVVACMHQHDTSTISMDDYDGGVQTVQGGTSWCHKTYCYGPTSDDSLPQYAIDGPHQDAGFISLRLSHNLIEGGTGCHEWEAGFFLAEFALSNPSIFRGKAWSHTGHREFRPQDSLLMWRYAALCRRQEVC